MRRALTLAMASAAALMGTQAQAATFFTDRMSFDAAGSGDLGFEDFNSTSGFFGTPLFFGSFTVEGAAALISTDITIPGSFGAPGTDGHLLIQLTTPGFTTTTLTGASSFQMIGFDWAAYSDGPFGDFSETVAYTTDTGESGFITTPGAGSTDFLGIAFDTQINSITFSFADDGNDFTWFGIDNAQVYASAVPEISTWIMMIAGLGFAGGALRRSGAKGILAAA